MFRSIRNQILIPIVAIQGLAVALVVWTAASLGARRMETQIVDRLNGVIETLGHAKFPYTGSVLEMMKGLSGAQFAAYTSDGRVTDSTLPSLHALPEGVPIGRVEALGASPTVVIDGTSYFAANFQTTAAPGGTSLLVLYPETAWRQARREAMTAPLVVGLGALALMVIVTGWIAQRIGRRIQQVETQVARIAAGDFEEFDEGILADEVQGLSRSVNHMCGQLRQMRETISQSERSRLLAQFGAGLAHQLRNSLTGARISVQLHARRFPPPEGDETLNVAIRQLAMTEEQVKGLLSLGRVEERPPALCDAQAILADVAFLVSPTCGHARVTLIYNNNAESLTFHADAAGVRAAVLNLTLNAIEATGAGGEVTLRAFSAGDLVNLEVVDNGPGPPANLTSELCEPFVTSKQEGVGLGLALARQVAHARGGRLEWTREGDFTTFRLCFPAASTTAKGVA